MTKNLQEMTRIEKIIWLLGNKLSEQEQNDISDMVQETIQSFKQSDKDAGLKLDYLWSRLKLDKLDESVQVELQNELLHAIKGQAGYHQAADYLWNTSTQLAPLRETVVGADIVGKDSNLQGDLYKRTKGADGLNRQHPKKRKYDEDEIDIEKKLEALKKLFMSRVDTKITMTAIKKILQSESIEERSNVRQKFKAAAALLKEDKTCENDLLKYYFQDGFILNESSGGSSSSTSWNSWQSVVHKVFIDSSGRVKASNSFLARIGERVDKQKLDYLLSKGLTVISLDDQGEETEIKSKPDWLKQ
jgi:hypothetical protein